MIEALIEIIAVLGLSDDGNTRFNPGDKSRLLKLLVGIISFFAGYGIGICLR
jgi:hypothetical protein